MVICSGDHLRFRKSQTRANKLLVSSSLGVGRQNTRRLLRRFCAKVQLYLPEGALRSVSRLMMEAARLSIVPWLRTRHIAVERNVVVSSS